MDTRARLDRVPEAVLHEAGFLLQPLSVHAIAPYNVAPGDHLHFVAVAPMQNRERFDAVVVRCRRRLDVELMQNSNKVQVALKYRDIVPKSYSKYVVVPRTEHFARSGVHYCPCMGT